MCDFYDYGCSIVKQFTLVAKTHSAFCVSGFSTELEFHAKPQRYNLSYTEKLNAEVI